MQGCGRGRENRQRSSERVYRPGRGNIYERLLAIRLPQFYADAGRNAEEVSEIMTEYLAAVDAEGGWSGRLRRRIRRSMRGCMRCTGLGRRRYGWWKDEER